MIYTGYSALRQGFFYLSDLVKAIKLFLQKAFNFIQSCFHILVKFLLRNQGLIAFGLKNLFLDFKLLF